MPGYSGGGLGGSGGPPWAASENSPPLAAMKQAAQALAQIMSVRRAFFAADWKRRSKFNGTPGPFVLSVDGAQLVLLRFTVGSHTMQRSRQTFLLPRGRP